jgi:hypothetical protein
MTPERKCHVFPSPQTEGSRNWQESRGYTWRQASLVIHTDFTIYQKFVP